MFLEAHQLPIAGARRKTITGFACQRDHRHVGAQGIAEQALGAKGGGAAFEVVEQRRADPVALPTIVDRKAELEIVVLEPVASFADDGLNAVDRHERDHAEAVALAGVGEMIELALRKLAHAAEETIVAGADRERAEEVLQRLAVVRFDKAHRERLAVAQPQNVGMLPKLVENERGHRRSSHWFGTEGGHSNPPKWLFGLANDVAP